MQRGLEVLSVHQHAALASVRDRTDADVFRLVAARVATVSIEQDALLNLCDLFLSSDFGMDPIERDTLHVCLPTLKRPENGDGRRPRILLKKMYATTINEYAVALRAWTTLNENREGVRRVVENIVEKRGCLDGHYPLCRALRRLHRRFHRRCWQDEVPPVERCLANRIVETENFLNDSSIPRDRTYAHVFLEYTYVSLRDRREFEKKYPFEPYETYAVECL